MVDTRTPPKVLIVGGGPSGLILALSLLQNGVPIRIIEKTTEPRLGQRGAGLTPRSLELLRTLRISGPVEKQSIFTPPVRRYESPGGTKVLQTFEMTPFVQPTPACPYMNIQLLGQDSMEKILDTALREHGCHVEKGTQLTSFRQFDERVEAKMVVQGQEGIEETATFDWLVGTDGARGVVRKMLGLSFLGETRTIENLVVGDVISHGLSRDYWHMWGDTCSTLVSLRPTESPNLFGFIVAGSEVNHAHLSSDENLLLEFMSKRTGSRPDLSFGPIAWMSHYVPNIRRVEKLSVNRVFIAGDAAHVHSLTGGQGVNASIQDAFNLGWKLALVANGLAPRSLLESYTEERIPVIAEMLDRTTKILARTFRDTSAAAWTRDTTLLQLGVNYRWSSIVVDEQKRRELSAEEREYNRVYGLDDEDELEDEGKGAGPGADGAILNSYGSEFSSSRLRAGDRAPDAPGLEDDHNTSSPCARRLFDIYGSSYHTILAFTNNIPERWTPLITLIAKYPQTVIRSYLVVRPGVALIPDDNADVPAPQSIFIDRAGHAHNAYDIGKRCYIVVVRPDGVVGAILQGPEGLDRYLAGIFGSAGAA